MSSHRLRQGHGGPQKPIALNLDQVFNDLARRVLDILRRSFARCRDLSVIHLVTSDKRLQGIQRQQHRFLLRQAQLPAQYFDAVVRSVRA